MPLTKYKGFPDHWEFNLVSPESNIGLGL